MNFEDTPEEAQFRAETRRWLQAHAPAFAPSPGDAQTLRDALGRARQWQALKAQRGYAAIAWPTEYGGLGGTQIQRVIYQQEEARYQLPRGFFEIGLGMCIPTLLAYATPAQLHRYVRPALYGEEIWCQMFSEPGGGSDVAAARMRAVRDGEDWILNGQKIWTSVAHLADFGIVFARSNPNVPKHAGLTFFFVDMKSAGITVRPIRQAGGGSEFNEVFYADVRVPDAQRLGPVDGGWKVALTTLMFERQLVGGGVPFPGAAAIIAAAQRAQHSGRRAIQDDRVRERIADCWLNGRALELNHARALTMLSRGRTPGPEFSIGKLVSAGQAQQVAYLLMDLAGPEALRVGEGGQLDVAQAAWFHSAALRVAGGTDEVLRNILAERVLGLPADYRPDKAGPFAQRGA